MAKDLTVIESAPRAMLSLPPQVASLANGLGTCQWPGEEMRYTIPSRMALGKTERDVAEERLGQIRMALDPHHPSRDACWKAKLSLLAKMILAYSVGASTEETADARVGAYLDALEDMPPWAIGSAIKRWHRGECSGLGFQPNYSFAPAPAHLRAICRNELVSFEVMAAKLERLLAAVPIAEATRTAADHVSTSHETFTGKQPDAGDVKPVGAHASRVMADLERRREQNARRLGAKADAAFAQHLEEIDREAADA